MRFLLDLNVWTDIAARPKDFPRSIDAYRILQQRAHEICFPLCGYTTVYYVLKQVVPEQGARAFFMLLREERVSLLPFSETDSVFAEGLATKNLEDACVLATAVSGRCTAIVARDKTLYSASPITVVRPNEIM